MTKSFGQTSAGSKRRGAFEFKWRPTETSRLVETDRVLYTFGDATKYGFTLSLNILMNRAALVRSNPSIEGMLRSINQHRVTRMSATPSVLAKHSWP